MPLLLPNKESRIFRRSYRSARCALLVVATFFLIRENIEHFFLSILTFSLTGIKDNPAAKIRDIIATGATPLLGKLRKGVPPALTELLRCLTS